MFLSRGRMGGMKKKGKKEKGTEEPTGEVGVGTSAERLEEHRE